MNECRGDRIYDDVSLICDKIEGVVVCFFFFTGKMEEEEEMEKGKRGGRLTGCNLKTNMDSPTNISDEFIFSVILSVIITHHFFHSFFHSIISNYNALCIHQHKIVVSRY